MDQKEKERQEEIQVISVVETDSTSNILYNYSVRFRAPFYIMLLASNNLLDPNLTTITPLMEELWRRTKMF